MRGMPSVATDSTCVSPRWNRPEPCAVGDACPTSADSGRMSVVPRPSMRTPSLTMRAARPSSAASGTPASPHRRGRRTARAPRRLPTSVASRSPLDLVEPRRCGRACRRSSSPRRPWRRRAARPRRTRRRRSRRGSGTRSARSCRAPPRRLAAQLELQVDRRVDPLLGVLEALGDDLFGDLRRAVVVEVPRHLGAAGLDHHDRDVAVVEVTAGDDDLERRLVTLLERRVRDPLALEVREAHRADRPVERDARSPSAPPTRR